MMKDEILFLSSRTNQGCLLLLVSFNIGLEIHACLTSQEMKEGKKENSIDRYLAPKHRKPQESTHIFKMYKTN